MTWKSGHRVNLKKGYRCGLGCHGSFYLYHDTRLWTFVPSSVLVSASESWHPYSQWYECQNTPTSYITCLQTIYVCCRWPIHINTLSFFPKFTKAWIQTPHRKKAHNNRSNHSDIDANTLPRLANREAFRLVKGWDLSRWPGAVWGELRWSTAVPDGLSWRTKHIERDLLIDSLPTLPQEVTRVTEEYKSAGAGVRTSGTNKILQSKEEYISVCFLIQILLLLLSIHIFQPLHLQQIPLESTTEHTALYWLTIVIHYYYKTPKMGLMFQKCKCCCECVWPGQCPDIFTRVHVYTQCFLLVVCSLK